MLRRHFLNNFSLGTSSLMIPNLAKEFISPNQSSYKFNLKYINFESDKNDPINLIIDNLKIIDFSEAISILNEKSSEHKNLENNLLNYFFQKK